MHDNDTVDGPKGELEVVSIKYPRFKVRLLEAVQEKRGDATRSETVRVALDRLIEDHFPGSTEAA